MPARLPYRDLVRQWWFLGQPLQWLKGENKNRLFQREDLDQKIFFESENGKKRRGRGERSIVRNSKRRTNKGNADHVKERRRKRGRKRKGRDEKGKRETKEVKIKEEMEHRRSKNGKKKILSRRGQKREEKKKKKKERKSGGRTRSWTEDLLICSQMLYHWAIRPSRLERWQRADVIGSRKG